jgi:hypothetical protein
MVAEAALAVGAIVQPLAPSDPNRDVGIDPVHDRALADICLSGRLAGNRSGRRRRAAQDVSTDVIRIVREASRGVEAPDVGCHRAVAGTHAIIERSGCKAGEESESAPGRSGSCLARGSAATEQPSERALQGRNTAERGYERADLRGGASDGIIKREKPLGHQLDLLDDIVRRFDEILRDLVGEDAELILELAQVGQEYVRLLAEIVRSEPGLVLASDMVCLRSVQIAEAVLDQQQLLRRNPEHAGILRRDEKRQMAQIADQAMSLRIGVARSDAEQAQERAVARIGPQRQREAVDDALRIASREADLREAVGRGLKALDRRAGALAQIILLSHDTVEIIEVFIFRGDLLDGEPDRGNGGCAFFRHAGEVFCGPVKGVAKSLVSRIVELEAKGYQVLLDWRRHI